MEKFIQTSYLPFDYLIGENGNVKSPKNKILKKSISNSGYECINIRNKGYFIHRALCFGFVDLVNGKNFVNHIDGNKFNNKISNLEWCTKSENTKHAYAKGLNKNIPLHYKGKFGAEHNRSIDIVINGLTYHGYSEASRILNLKISLIHYRVNSKNKKWMHFEIKK